MVSQYMRSLSGFEVYTTDDTIQTKELSSDDDENHTEDEGFQLLNGDTIQIDYYANMFSNSFEEDYEDISQKGNVSFPEVDNKVFYKGKKVCLKKVWENENEQLTWDDLEVALLGFITEQNYSQDTVELQLVGMTKLLDKEEKFDFQQMKMSEILKEMIETAGLKAEIDTTGLNDEVIDYSNISSSSDDSGGYSGDVSEDIAEAAKQICKGKKSCLEKAKAIWKYCHDEIKYEGYSNSQKGAERCFKEKSGNCCDHANVVVQMLKTVKVKCAYEHSSTCYGTGHVWAVAYCDGTWYRIDASVKSRGFNEVGNGCTGTRKETLGF